MKQRGRHRERGRLDVSSLPCRSVARCDEATFPNAYGPRVEATGTGLIPRHACSAPYKDSRLKPDAK